MATPDYRWYVTPLRPTHSDGTPLTPEEVQAKIDKGNAQIQAHFDEIDARIAPLPLPTLPEGTVVLMDAKEARLVQQLSQPNTVEIASDPSNCPICNLKGSKRFRDRHGKIFHTRAGVTSVMGCLSAVIP